MVSADIGFSGTTHVHLDHTGLDSLGDLVLGRTGTTVEDEVDGLVVGALELLLGVSLVLLEELGAELDISGYTRQSKGK